MKYLLVRQWEVPAEMSVSAALAEARENFADEVADHVDRGMRVLEMCGMHVSGNIVQCQAWLRGHDGLEWADMPGAAS